jgi:hypothetical protein
MLFGTVLAAILRDAAKRPLLWMTSNILTWSRRANDAGERQNFAERSIPVSYRRLL